MSLQLEFHEDSNVLHVVVSGQLTSKDYERWVPQVEKLMTQHGKLNIFVEMRGFHGWDAGGIWEEAKFDAKHVNDVEHVAIVGDKTWQKLVTQVCKPFSTGRARFFEFSEIDEARQWIGFTPGKTVTCDP